MKFKEAMIDALGHCVPVERIEDLAKKFEGEIEGHVEWRVSKLRDELVALIAEAKSAVTPKAASASK